LKNYKFSNTETVVETVIQASPRFEPPAKKRKNFSLLCEEVEIEPEKEMTSRDIIISEFRLYLTLKGLITEHTCPLEFYKLNFLN
jgi:hypothetical protein